MVTSQVHLSLQKDPSYYLEKTGGAPTRIRIHLLSVASMDSVMLITKRTDLKAPPYPEGLSGRVFPHKTKRLHRILNECGLRNGLYKQAE